jgi:hypothetical protein
MAIEMELPQVQLGEHCQNKGWHFAWSNDLEGPKALLEAE